MHYFISFFHKHLSRNNTEFIKQVCRPHPPLPPPLSWFSSNFSPYSTYPPPAPLPPCYLSSNFQIRRSKNCNFCHVKHLRSLKVKTWLKIFREFLFFRERKFCVVASTLFFTNIVDKCNTLARTMRFVFVLF